MRRCVFASFLLFLLAAGCGSTDKPIFTEKELAQIPLPQREGLPAVSGGFTLSIAGEVITSDDIVLPLVEHFRDWHWEPIWMSLGRAQQSKSSSFWKTKSRIFCCTTKPRDG